MRWRTPGEYYVQHIRRERLMKTLTARDVMELRSIRHSADVLASRAKAVAKARAAFPAQPAFAEPRAAKGGESALPEGGTKAKTRKPNPRPVAWTVSAVPSHGAGKVFDTYASYASGLRNLYDLVYNSYVNVMKPAYEASQTIALTEGKDDEATNEADRAWLNRLDWLSKRCKSKDKAQPLEFHLPSAQGSVKYAIDKAKA